MGVTEDIEVVQDLVELAAQHFRNKDWPALETTMEHVAMDLHEIRTTVARSERRSG